jgi:cell division protein FtsL
MNHKFLVIRIHVEGVCENCHQHIDARELITERDFKQMEESTNPNYWRNILLEKVWKQIDEHECKTIKGE